MTVILHKCHLIATCRPKSEGTTSRSNMCIRALIAKEVINLRLEAEDLENGLYKEDEYFFEEGSYELREDLYYIKTSASCNLVLYSRDSVKISQF